MIIRTLIISLSLIFSLNVATAGEISMLKNLNNIDFEQKSYVIETTKELIKNSNDSYNLSMPLLVGAQLGNESLYNEAQAKMSQAIVKDENNTFKAWLYGRMLVAAFSMDKEHDIKNTKESLTSLLSASNNNENKNEDFFRAWTLAYYGMASDEFYHANKQDMIDSANAITDVYSKTLADSSKDEASIQGARSNALWSWVMISIAAANNQDQEIYELTKQKMQDMMNEKSAANALYKGLLRTSASNDYPAWALGLVQLAAARMKDDVLFEEIESVITTSITEAIANEKGKAESILGIVNHELAIENKHLLENTASASNRV